VPVARADYGRRFMP